MWYIGVTFYAFSAINAEMFRRALSFYYADKSIYGATVIEVMRGLNTKDKLQIARVLLDSNPALEQCNEMLHKLDEKADGFNLDEFKRKLFYTPYSNPQICAFNMSVRIIIDHYKKQKEQNLEDTKELRDYLLKCFMNFMNDKKITIEDRFPIPINLMGDLFVTSCVYALLLNIAEHVRVKRNNKEMHQLEVNALIWTGISGFGLCTAFIPNISKTASSVVQGACLGLFASMGLLSYINDHSQQIQK